MKKFASVLLAVLVAFSMFSFVVSAAAPSLTVKADKTTVKAGDTVKATVSVSENSGIAALTVDLKYDASAFEVVSITKGTTLFKGENDMEMTNKSYAAGAARYIGVATEAPITAAGDVFTVELKALTDAESTFSLNVAEAKDGNNKDITVTTNSVVINDGAVEEPSTDKPEEPSTDKPEEPSTDKPEEPSTDKPSDDPCADGHTWSSWNVVKTAECKKDGLKNRNCTVCGEKEEEAIPATGTCSKKWVVTKEATATEYGEKVLKCTMCGQVYDTQKLALKNDSADSLDKPAIPNTDAIA